MSKNWFVIHARSGYEAKVKVAIEEAVAREGIEDLVVRSLFLLSR